MSRDPAESRLSANRLRAELNLNMAPIRRRVLHTLRETNGSPAANGRLARRRVDGLCAQAPVAYLAPEPSIGHDFANKSEGINALVAGAHPEHGLVPSLPIYRFRNPAAETRAEPATVAIGGVTATAA